MAMVKRMTPTPMFSDDFIFNMNCDNGEMIRDLALQGLGISFLPDFFVADDLQSGKLVQILTEFEPDGVGVYAVFPPRHQVSSSARVFVDWLVSHQK